MDKTGKWILLVYRVPREPSTPRIAIWRKFKILGVAQLLDGLVALPHSRRNQEQLEWISQEITEAEGQANLWIGQLSSRSQELDLVRTMCAAVAAEYVALTNEMRSRSFGSAANRTRALGRVRREVHKIHERDYFAVPEGDQARAVLDDLLSKVGAVH